MKEIIGAVILIVIASLTQSAPLNTDQIARCLQETSLDMVTAMGFLKGDFPNDQRAKDFIYCISLKMKFINENGDMLIDSIRSAIPARYSQDTAMALLDMCKQDEKDVQDRIYKTLQCVYKANLKLYKSIMGNDYGKPTAYIPLFL